MTIASAADGIRAILLSELKVSNTVSQAERRKYFDQVLLADLVKSIKKHGVLVPVIARPVNGHFELIAGERRYLAAKSAGLTAITTDVRTLTDDQVLEIQLIENLQREGLHELAEAEGYEALLALKHSAEEIADKVGKSKAYVYARMKLLALCQDARKAFYEGSLTASTALLIARIPGDEQQQRALKHITEKDWAGRSMSYRDAAKYVHDTFMLKLSDAPFPREDATLVPSAGACGPCPMRTGNAPGDLFGEVKGADVCTNPACFQSKKAAHVKRELEKAKASGQDVIRGAEARRILPDARGHSYSSDGSHKQLRNGFARPGDKCLDDPKKRTYAELAGKDAPKVLLQNPDTGRVEKVFKVEAIADKLKAKGIKPAPVAKDRTEAREHDEQREKQRRELELHGRRAIFQAILEAAPKKLSHEDLAILVSKGAEICYGDDEAFYEALGWKPPKKTSGRDSFEQAFLAQLLTCSEGRLAQMAVAITVINLAIDDYEKPTELEALAKRLGLDPNDIRASAAPPAPKPEKPKAKKKAGAKK